MNTLILLAALACQDRPFAEGDPAKAIEAATRKAAMENRRVLVLWGKNDSEESRAAASLLLNDKAVKRLVLFEYDLVIADAEGADVLAKASLKTLGMPLLSFYAPDGKWSGHYKSPGDAEEMLKVLKQNQAKPLVAKDVLDAALKKAGDQKKRVLLTFGAPWCGWCKRFEAWMAREDAAPLHKEFVTVKIDIDRMTGGKEILAKFPKSEGQGIPWFVFLQPDATELGDSMGPDGNIGCPNADEEIDLFIGLLKKVSVNLSADDLSALKKSLKANQVKR